MTNPEPHTTGQRVSSSWLADLRAAEEAATPGPWKLWGMSVLADLDGTSNVDTARPVADTLFRDEHGKPRTFDADLICLLRNNAPQLLAAAEAIERVRAVCKPSSDVVVAANRVADEHGVDRDVAHIIVAAVLGQIRPAIRALEGATDAD